MNIKELAKQANKSTTQKNMQKPIEEWQGQSNIESPHNACQHRNYCKQLKAFLKNRDGGYTLTNEMKEFLKNAKLENAMLKARETK